MFNFKNIIFSIMVLGLASCATERSLADRAADRKSTAIQISQPLELSDFLVRVPGVYVDGRGGFTDVTIRGGRPLYVVDGVRLGNNYEEANGLVNVNDIASVEVLKTATETIPYGREAAYGAIIIMTRTQ